LNRQHGNYLSKKKPGDEYYLAKEMVADDIETKKLLFGGQYRSVTDDRHGTP
jgi:hypothetical protein